MKTYVSKPVHVQAAQWDGSKASALALKKDFGINHDNIAYNKDGSVAKWSIGDRKTQLNIVHPTNYFVKDEQGNVIILTEKLFTARFDLSE